MDFHKKNFETFFLYFFSYAYFAFDSFTLL